MRRMALRLGALSHLPVILDIFCSASFHSSAQVRTRLCSLPVLLLKVNSLFAPARMIMPCCEDPRVGVAGSRRTLIPVSTDSDVCCC